MRKSIVAIVGRPNVGKSTLFNRLCRKRRAIVDFEEGITRDLKYEDVVWNGRVFSIVDTGGIIPGSTDTMDEAVRNQAEVSIQEADFIIFLVDAQTGTTAMDQEIARILRFRSDKVMIVANKADNEKFESEVYDFLQLGFGDAFPVSAVHGRNTGQFLDALVRQIETIPEEEPKDEDDGTIRIAIVGRPNVGKSSLVNRFTGEKTVIVTDIPGTTRDAIDTTLTYYGRKLVLIDTAGLRKKGRVRYGVEYFSSMRTLESLRRADVVLMILDADREVATQDQKIVSWAYRHHKNILIVVNKWDLVEKDTGTSREFEKNIYESLPFLEHVPVIFVSAQTGQRVRAILEHVVAIDDRSRARIPTSKLNDFLEGILRHRPPTHKTGKLIRIYYVTQAEARPPTFVFFCNNPSLISEQYKRYLLNRLRDSFDFRGVAVRLRFRGREKRDVVDD